MATPTACWVILVGTVPTAFRAKTRDELLPTFRQLQRRQPDVMLRWFEHGKVWESPDAAKAAILLARTEARESRRPAEPRGKDWRPGGSHRDPNARPTVPRDVKRARFKSNLIRRKTSGRG